MKIVSWNVHRCIGTDGKYRPDRIAEGLTSFRADVVALQEIDSSLRVSDGTDQLAYLAAALGMHVVMAPTLELDYGAYGNALLSKEAFSSFEEFDLSYRRFEPRGALKAQTHYGEMSVQVVVTHLGLKYWERSYQIDQLMKKVEWKSQTLSVLLGDFNEWYSWGENTRELERRFLRSPRLGTFPSRWPSLPLDRILIRGWDGPIFYEVPKNKLTQVASDHLPLVAKLQLS